MIKRKSSKQSSTLELPDYTFFCDRDLGRSFPELLKQSGFNVEIHDDHFSQDTEDIDWFRSVGRNGWIVISRNHKQKRVDIEREVWMTSGIRGFYIIGQWPFPDLAQNLVNNKHRLVKFLNKHTDPFMAKVYMPTKSASSKPGEIKMWYSYKDWNSDNSQ